jgi:hypothetical protein
MLTSEEIIRFLKRNKKNIQKEFHCREIGLFGSFARNEQNEDSDVDILVEYEPGTPDLYTTEIQLKEYLQKQFNRKVDICSRKWIKPIFKKMVLNDTLYA